jgi:hypothetical protein
MDSKLRRSESGKCWVLNAQGGYYKQKEDNWELSAVHKWYVQAPAAISVYLVATVISLFFLLPPPRSSNGLRYFP